MSSDSSSPNNPSAGSPSPDPFDVNALRLSPALTAGLGVKKVLLTVPVRKPDRSWFVRVHDDPGYSLATAVIEVRDGREETYLVARDLWDGLAGEATFSPRVLYTAVNRQGVVFLWPVKLPGPDGRQDQWSRSAADAVELAKRGWVRVTADMGLGSYQVFQATGDLPEPEWPDLPFGELLKIAFRDKMIQDRDHPVLRQLRGEV
jgi:hypothetical protein